MTRNKLSGFALTIVLTTFTFACSTFTSTTTSMPVDEATPTEGIPSAMLTTEATSVRLTLVTGDDGTADNPVFELYDPSFVPVFAITLDNPGDLQPGQTDVYEFSVPEPLCQIVAWQLTKPSGAGGDDAWVIAETYIALNGLQVFFVRSPIGPVTADMPAGGNWSGIDVYLQHCGE